MVVDVGGVCGGRHQVKVARVGVPDPPVGVAVAAAAASAIADPDLLLLPSVLGQVQTTSSPRQINEV